MASEHDRWAFLSLLGKEMPLHIAFQECLKLHSVTKYFYYYRYGQYDYKIPRGHVRACTKQDFGQQIYKHLYFAIVQLAMKRHQLGLDTSPQLDLLRQKRTSRERTYVYRCQTEPRIVNSCLYVRIQHIFVVPRSDGIHIPCYEPDIVCPHVGNLYLFSRTPLTRTARCLAKHWNGGYGEESRCESCSSTHSCDKFLTEYRIDRKDYSDGRRIAPVVTVWKLLGYGESHEDPFWRNHIMPTSLAGEEMTGLECASDHGLQWGDLQRVFEGEGDGREWRFDDDLLPSDASRRYWGFLATNLLFEKPWFEWDYDAVDLEEDLAFSTVFE